uniref:Uncharacterized protein n=1 Tax=Salix viminalis TaxID=40686 RepID=A0A6N2JZC8_SALVM
MNSHQHSSFICFPCKPLPLLFQSLELSLCLSFCLLLTWTTQHQFVIFCSSSLSRNTPAILSKHTSKALLLQGPNDFLLTFLA